MVKKTAKKQPRKKRFRDDLVRIQMAKRGETVETLQVKIGRCGDTISRVRNGKNCSVDALLDVAEGLGLEPQKLFVFEKAKNTKARPR